jgi:hypothetical protein
MILGTPRPAIRLTSVLEEERRDRDVVLGERPGVERARLLVSVERFVREKNLVE